MPETGEENSQLVICVTPYDSENGYNKEQRRALSQIGLVSSVLPFKTTLWNMLRLRFYRADYLVVNWVENRAISSRTGRVSVHGLVKLFLIVYYYKTVSRKTVFVRHNLYPHHTCSEHKGVAKKITDWCENRFDVSITHSGHNATSTRHYVPHPLYRLKEAPEVDDSRRDYFVVFGRIEPYKNIADLIRAFPSDKCLVVAGPCQSSEYLKQLVAEAKEKDVIFKPYYLEEKAASKLVANSKGTILAHCGTDMIVSGSFFYSVGLGTPVYAVSTPFSKWLSINSDFPGLFLFPSLSEMCKGLSTTKPTFSKQAIKLVANEMFGDQATVNAWRDVFRSF